MKDILEHYVKNVIYTISEDLGTFQQVPNILVVLVSIIIKIQLLQQQQAYGQYFQYLFLSRVMCYQMKKQLSKKQFQQYF
ncbi:unnamed protein product [Paramecium primaurelia]|uniref:Uncharacterized protein n=1 Tax=Paramecium primaurelia TaxID=5886 RepID=A0A8S1Q180_PARPR|nr:unnamed protein product [Paramecium primaurelia]